MVANEVKELAKATALATDEIGGKIETIQGDTHNAVEAIAKISLVIEEINEISNQIAAAVEEQNATTNEISRNVAQAASGTTHIATNIAGVATAALDTTRGATDSQTAARALSRMASELRVLIDRFEVVDRRALTSDPVTSDNIRASRVKQPGSRACPVRGRDVRCRATCVFQKAGV